MADSCEILPNGFTEIIVDTTEYAGNFERALTAWVFGVVNEYDTDNDFMVEDPALAWARYDETVYEPGALELIYRDKGYEDWQDLAETPGWVNDGMGNCRRVEPGEAWGSACQSVRWKFSRRLSDEECASAVTRILSFPEAYLSRGPSYVKERGLEIESVRVLDAEITRRELEREQVIPV